jgi:hypothetical protein
VKLELDIGWRALRVITPFVIMGLAAWLAWVGPEALRNDQVAWCYIHTSGTDLPHGLWGYRRWHPDISLGAYRTPADLFEVANRIGCRWPVKAELPADPRPKAD